jgi:hypothetical protein
MVRLFFLFLFDETRQNLPFLLLRWGFKNREYVTNKPLRFHSLGASGMKPRSVVGPPTARVDRSHVAPLGVWVGLELFYWFSLCFSLNNPTLSWIRYSFFSLV